jgi:2-dehydro-3-deoxyglucarate aldolase
MEQINLFRKNIQKGEVVLGARASSFSPALIEIYGELDLDFVWLDFEHAGESPWDTALFENLTRAAEVGGIELFVRIPAPDQALIRKVLDAGVRNLLIPRPDTAEEVRHAVEATRFVYDGEPGERGIAGSRSSGYGNAENYVEKEDQNICIGVMIEKKAAVDNLSEILSVPELGFVFIGPGDLSVQLGHPGDRDHPEVRKTISEIEAEVRDSPVALGGIAHDADLANKKVQNGYQILRIGGEFEAAQEVLRGRLDDISAFSG